MTYHCGIGPGMAALGLTPRAPHVVCDTCGIAESAETKDGLPKRWLLGSGTPPGWRTRRDSEKRTDTCARCAKGGRP